MKTVTTTTYRVDVDMYTGRREYGHGIPSPTAPDRAPRTMREALRVARHAYANRAIAGGKRIFIVKTTEAETQVF